MSPSTISSSPRLAALFIGLALVALTTWNTSQPVAIAQQATPTPEQTNQVNVFANQTTVVVLPSPRPEQPQAVIFFNTDDREAVKAGDILTYRAVVQNPRSDDLNEIRVTAHIPDYLVPLETSPAAEANAQARTLVWSNQTISARSEITFAFRVQVSADTPANTLIRTTAEIHGPGVRASSTDQTIVEAGRVAPSVEPVAPAAVAPAATTAPAVPTTARTGAGMTLLIAGGATLAGASGAVLLRRRVRS